MKKQKNLSRDANKRAFEIVRLSIGEQDEQISATKEPSLISAYLANIGRKGGLKGGKARAKKLTPEQRKEIARKAASARWKK